jgi:hypothetical protein
MVFGTNRVGASLYLKNKTRDTLSRVQRRLYSAIEQGITDTDPLTMPAEISASARIAQLHAESGIGDPSHHFGCGI